MAIKKYINTADVVELTGCTTNEVLNLAKTGVLPTHKTRRGHYRFNVEAVQQYFGIQINKPAEEVVDNQVSIAEVERASETCLITNEDHYQEVVQRICAAKSSIRIMTANFKRFNLKPTGCQGNGYKDGTPFIKYLMAKAVQGVSVQIICSNPSPSFKEEWKGYYRQMGKPSLYKYKFCDRNHAKVVIIDDRIAYVGSANVTPAGIGQGIFTPGNFETGILTENHAVIAELNALFIRIMQREFCEDCHRKKDCEDRMREE